MTEQEIKKVIIDTMLEQKAFQDLSPQASASLVIDMVFAILRTAQEQ